MSSPVNTFTTYKEKDQPRLRIGSLAPNFKAMTTAGPIEDFHKWIGKSWVILFSHPADFTPVCTTELGAFAAMKGEFDKRNVKLIGLSTEGVESHGKWIKDIEDITPDLKTFTFPIIADESREVAFFYNMVDEEGFKALETGAVIETIRTVYIIAPNKRIRLSFTYPPSCGRNTFEVLRVVDALQMSAKNGVATPVDWVPGQDVMVPPFTNNEEALKKFGNIRVVKPYVRYTKL